MRRRARLNSQIEMADRHYRHILLPLTFETWKQKWRYFAVLQRRVERDRIKVILARCLEWWRYRNQLILKQNDRIHNEVALRRTFKAWLSQICVKRQRMESLTLSNVMERWKEKASTTRDLHAMAENWSRRHTIHRYWKEWFFRTCSVKTVQYYQIKLKHRTLGQWKFRTQRAQQLNRHAGYMARKNIAISTLTKWKAATQKFSGQKERAKEYWRQNILFKYISIWRKNQQLSLRAALLGDKVDNELINRAWKRWREITYAIYTVWWLIP
jgi:hypothetical protein